MNAPAFTGGPIQALLDCNGHLREADIAIAQLQEEAGGQRDGPLAVPALAAVTRLAQRLNMAISRPVEVSREDRDISMWVKIVPEGDGLRLAVTDWVERAPRLLDQEVALASRITANEAKGWAWEIDNRLRFRVVDVRQEDIGHAPPQAGEPLTGYFVLSEDGGATDHPMPVIEALARRAPFQGQGAALRMAPSVRYLLSALPLFDLHGHLLGYRGNAVRIEAQDRLDTDLEAAAVRGPDDLRARDAANEKPQHVSQPLLGADLSRRLDQALRKPLGRIIANASTISSQLEGPLRQDYADYAADIAAAGRHLVELVDDLADLQAIERPGFSPAQEEVDLADLARRAAGLLNVRAAARNITIVTPGSGERAVARAEYRRVLQILVNLIGNAVRYSPDGSSIWIRVDDEDGRASAVVADQGRGIDAMDHGKIFDRFERLSTEESSGSGLGLYISRRLANAMHGDITVESALGQGARFTLDLPAWSIIT